MTNKQKQLLKLILDEHKHLTAEEVYELAKTNGLDISLASVYRILGVLVDTKQLKKVSNIYKEDTYDVWVENHEHLVCSKCGKVTDLKIADLEKTLRDYTNVDIQDFDLCIRYVCDECKKKEG